MKAFLSFCALTALCLLPRSAGLKRFEPGHLQDIHSIHGTQQDTHSYSERVKRSTNEDLEVISNLSSAFHLHNNHLHLMVHWVGQGSSRVFCLGKDQEMKAGATSQVFLSSDYGTTFADISARFQIPDASAKGGSRNATINKFYHHPKSNCHYVFTDTLNKYIFTSIDCGDTISRHKLEMSPELIEFDPSHDKIFLIHDLMDTEKKLYVTKNFGETFSHVQDYVKAFYFRADKQDTVLYIQRLKPQGIQSTILSSRNFFERQVDTSILYSDASEFEMRSDFMFVTKPNPSQHPDHLELFLSMNGERFVPANFGTGVTNLDYHVIDVTPEGQVIVCVNHDESHSNLYISTKITPYEVEFSLSLERVMYYNPKVTWQESWLQDTAGDQPFADVYKVQGLRGIYIASQIRAESMNKSQIQPEDLVSLITFDQGGKWAKIQGPETDEEGYKFPACASGPCSLHLAQQLSKRFPSTRSIPIMSSSSAVGIVMATGNMGESLTKRSDVFLSADAGLSWHQVLKGSYYFNVGDHGGVIVAVKYFKTEGATKELLYSTNEGVDWKSLVFYHEPLKVFGLLTEPGENTTTFTMFGTTKSGTHLDWIIVKIDLRSIFSHDCTEDDYKRWSPADGSIGKHRNCILGRKEIYERRTINSNCYNGLDYERVITVENCGCDRSDYLCDFGFQLDQSWTDNCIKDVRFDFDSYAIPSDCPPGSFFNRTSGYIKIRGDSCVGGLDKRFEPQQVACPVKEESEFLLVSQRQAIVRINLRDTTDVQTLPLKNINNVITLEFDLEDNCVMYGDIELDQIFIQCLNGSEPRVLVENNLASVEGMAYDWITKTLYFVDGTRRTIELVRVDLQSQGRMRKTILHGKALTKPRGLAVHPLHGYLFYTDWNDKQPHIGRVNMDGSGRKILFSSPLVQWPNGLSIDYIANRIYWVDAQKDFIASCDMDGKQFKKVLSNVPQLIHPFSVAIHKELMYWDDWNRKAIYFADKNSGKGITPVQSNMNGAMDLKIFSTLHRSGKNACSAKPCSHLCVAMPEEKFQCLCPDGMKAEKVSGQAGVQICKCPDGSVPNVNGSCRQSNGSCDATQFTCLKNQLCIPSLWKCDGDDDCGDRSDEADCVQDKCHEYQFQCKNRKCIPDYWKCDFDNDCGDGSDEQNCTLTSCTKDQFKCANGQCISNKWKCDLEKDCQDGSDEKDCLKQAPTCKKDEFQCPEAGQCLPSSWKCDGDNDCPGGADELNCGVKACKDWQFTCDNGHCIFQTWRCDNASDCSDGSDEKNCTGSEAATTGPVLPEPVFPQAQYGKGECNEWMFKCRNEQCIPFWWKCDGATDCSDGSDELECNFENKSHTDHHHETTPAVKQNGCSANKFQCTDGKCIWQAWVCDTDPDCVHGEDEDPAICHGRAICTTDQYRCEMSGECIDYSQVCNDKQDCSDGSDEQGCQDESHPNHESHCQDGFFSCDEGICVPSSAMCDGKPDCEDGIDEIGCSHSHFDIMGVMADTDAISSTSIRIDWWTADVEQKEELEFQPTYEIVGTGLWYKAEWQKAHAFTYTFSKLFSFTTYNMTVHVRHKGREYLGKRFAVATTAVSIPGAPTITTVEQEGQNVRVTWTPPSRPNGEIVTYVVHMDPPGREWQSKGNETSLLIDAMFKTDETYSFTVTAVNTEFHGNGSKPKTLTYLRNVVLDEVKGLQVIKATENKVSLKWDPPVVKGSELKQFKVSYKSDNPLAFYDDIIISDSSSIDISTLSPSETYSVSVAEVKGNLTGPTSTISVTTTGKPLPKLIITDAQISPESGTSILLTWKLPENEKKKNGWTYGIYYGVGLTDMFAQGKAKYVVQDEMSYTVKHLSSCESYSFVVAVIGPAGFGPPSEPFSKASKYSPGAPPKNVNARMENDTDLWITWDASCPKVDENIAYLVKVTDVVKNKTTYVQTVTSTQNSFKHKMENIHFGTTLEVSVMTNAVNSISSQPVLVNSPAIPTPQRLTHHFTEENNVGKQLIYWNSAADLPKYMSSKDKSYTYQLFISENPNMSDPQIFNVSKPPHELDSSKLSPGRPYFMAVALVDSDGYRSALTSPVGFENPVPKEDIVISPTGVAGVLIPILIIMVLLGAGLGYYVYRNRRLTRSFQAFASRYSPASGAAILNQSSLDEDDDSPIIRGFSDDEPLVIS